MQLIFTLLSAKMKSRLDGKKKAENRQARREALVPLDRLLKPCALAPLWCSQAVASFVSRRPAVVLRLSGPKREKGRKVG